MTEREPTEINHQRIETAAGRFQRLIIDGIGEAHARGGEIDEGTARTIAHVLGRALGRESSLAEFGRTADGQYEELRDEYLLLYNDATTPPMVKEWIDWFGTYLVQNQRSGSGRQFMNEQLPPKLYQLLVTTEIDLPEGPHLIHVPASSTRSSMTELSAHLERLVSTSDGRALSAFLGLPDVNAADPNLMESFAEAYVGFFSDVEDALYGLVSLEEWEDELRQFTFERGINHSAVSIDHSLIEEQTREVYDLVELRGRVYAFHK